MNEKELKDFVAKVETRDPSQEVSEFANEYPIMTTLLYNLADYGTADRNAYGVYYADLIIKEFKKSKVTNVFSDKDFNLKSLLLWPAALDMNLNSGELVPINAAFAQNGIDEISFEDAVDFLNEAIGTGTPTYTIAVLKGNQPEAANLLTYFLKYATSIIVSDCDLDDEEWDFLVSLESALKTINVKEVVKTVDTALSSNPETAEAQQKLPHMFQPLINLNRFSDQERIEYAKHYALEFATEFKKTLAKKHGDKAETVLVVYLAHILALDGDIAREEFDYLTQVLAPLNISVPTIDILVDDYLLPAVRSGQRDELIEDLIEGPSTVKAANAFVRYSSAMAGADGEFEDEEFDCLFEIQDFLLNV